MLPLKAQGEGLFQGFLLASGGSLEVAADLESSHSILPAWVSVSSHGALFLWTPLLSEPGPTALQYDLVLT